MASSTWRDGPEWDNNIPLTAQWVKGLPGGAERRERRDGPNPNLWLVLQPKTGAKSWQYRGVALGEEIRTTLGKLVTMTLADARRAHDDLRVKIAKGEYVPPKMSAARAAGAADAMTVQKAWSLYMTSAVVGVNCQKEEDSKWRFYNRDIGPAIGSKALVDVTFEDMARLIVARYDRMIAAAEAKGKETNGASANRLHRACSAFLNWCAYDTVGRVRTGLRHNPMGRMKPVAKNGVRKRALEDWELVYFFRALPVAGLFAPCFETLLRSVCRLGNIIGMEWDMVRLDDVLFPTTKNDLPHWLYLTDDIRALLGQRSEDGKAKVFGISEAACSNPMGRLRARMDELAAEDGKEIEHWTLHDFRRTATNHLAGLEDRAGNKLFDHETRELLLGHKRRGIDEHYQVNGLRNQRRRALNRWGDHLKRLKAKAASIEAKAVKQAA